MRIRNRSNRLSLLPSPLFHRETADPGAQPTKEGGQFLHRDHDETEEKGRSGDRKSSGASRGFGFADIRHRDVGFLQRQSVKEYRGPVFLSSPNEESRQKVEKVEEDLDENRNGQSFAIHGKHHHSQGRSWCEEKNTFRSEKSEVDLEWASDEREDNDAKDSSDDEGRIHNQKKKKGKSVERIWNCTRMNGRGWRCSKPTLVGYRLCEHHLGKGRRIKTIHTLAPKDQFQKEDDSSEASKHGNNELRKKDIAACTTVKNRRMSSLLLDHTSNS